MQKPKVITSITGTCPKGHPLTIVDDGEFLFGTCDTCDDTWRVMFDGQIIPKGHPLG